MNGMNGERTEFIICIFKMIDSVLSKRISFYIYGHTNEKAIVNTNKIE